MNPEAFDRLSRRMAAATTRRGLLKAFVAGLAGIGLSTLAANGAFTGVTIVEPGSSAGQECNTSEYTKSCGKVTEITSSGTQRTYDYCCAKDATCCSADNAACCSPNQQCCGGKACCDPGQICQDGECKSCTDGIVINNACCPALSVCTTAGGHVCCTDGSCVSAGDGSSTCCPKAQVCGQACCSSGQSCTNGICCTTGNVVCNGVCCSSGESCTDGVCCSLCNGNCCRSGEVCINQCPPEDICEYAAFCCSADKVCGHSCCRADQYCTAGVCCPVGFRCIGPA